MSFSHWWENLEATLPKQSEIKLQPTSQTKAEEMRWDFWSRHAVQTLGRPPTPSCMPGMNTRPQWWGSFHKWAGRGSTLMGLGVEGATPTPPPEKEQALCPCWITQEGCQEQETEREQEGEHGGHPDPEALTFLGTPTNLNNAWANHGLHCVWETS